MEIDFGSTDTRRMPVYLVVDCGAAMAQHIQVVSQLLEMIHSDMLAHPQLVEMSHISVITFSDSPRQVIPLVPVTVFMPPPLVATNKQSDLSDAVDFLLDRVLSEMKWRNTARNGDRTPLIVFLLAQFPSDLCIFKKIGAEISFLFDDPGFSILSHPLLYCVGDALYFCDYRSHSWNKMNDSELISRLWFSFPSVSVGDDSSNTLKKDFLRSVLNDEYKEWAKPKKQYYLTSSSISRKDIVYDLVTSVLGSSCRGMKQWIAITFREDAFEFAEENGWILVAVTDGSSTSNLARVEANIAVQIAIQAMRISISKKSNVFPANTLDARLIILYALSHVYSAFMFSGVGATTLLLLACHPKRGLVGSVQIGDGLLAVQLENQQIELLGEPKPGEYFSDFFGEGGLDQLAARVQVRTINNPRMLLAMTDGIADDFYPPKENLIKLINAIPPVLSEKKPGKALLELIQYERDGSTGDRTLVVVGPTVKETAKPYPPPLPGFEIIL